MKNLLLVMAAFLLPYLASAQFTVSGRITDATTGEPLPGASVLLNQKTAGVTNAEGTFTFTDVAAGSHAIRVSYLGFETYNQSIEVPQTTPLQISLKKGLFLKDEVLVTATRANEKTGTTFTNLSREEIEERNFGQDIPYILDQTPSVVVNSDAGAGVGYTGIRIRGSDITRINVTVNGIPINDAESHGAFFINMPDLASSVQDIQIQRGVGTSTNGAGAFGASINIQSLGLRREAYAEAVNTYGSFNTWRHTAAFGTGLINNKFAIDGRMSKISSDGYVDRAFSDLKSFYLSAGYHGETGMLKFVTFSGKEQTYQAWNGIPEDKLETDRTYNSLTYDNETDNYQQDHYQLHYSKTLSSRFDLGGAFHLTRGRGYYEQLKENAKLANYSIPAVVLNDTTISRTDLIRQKWLDNHFYGATYALNYASEEGNLLATLGGAWNQYDGDHFGEVIWARYASVSNIRHRYYFNNALKTDFNTFLKVNYQLTEKLGVFGDIQYRTVNYEIDGIDDNNVDVTTKADFQFWNPKAGLTYAVSDKQTFYASFAVANREPVRSDFTDQNPIDRANNVRPLPERLKNWEAGYRFRENNLTFLGTASRFNLDANLFYMDYDNQLVLTGQLNDVGNPLRTNIKDSYRAGFEFAGVLNANDFIEFRSTLSLSRNKIQDYTETVYVYDENYELENIVENKYQETDISFSPSVVTGHTLEIQPLKGFKAAVLYKTVSKQYLDNTSSDDRRLNGYQVTDLRFRYTRSLPFMKEIEIALLVNNVLNQKYEANGWTFSEMYAGDPTRYSYNYYYPQATRNFLVSVGVKF